MRKSLVSTLIYALGNAIGLALAALLLPGFKIGVTAFVVAVLIFSGLQLILKPFIIKLSKKRVPALEGGIALVTTFISLFLTSILVSDMVIGGISNWLLATLIVWLGALIAGTILPRYVFKKSDVKK